MIYLKMIPRTSVGRVRSLALVFKLMLVIGVSACDTRSDTALDAASSSTELLEQYSDLFSDQSSAFRDLLDSEKAQAIANSFQVPELPDGPIGFRTEPDARFEQWSLSSMTQSSQSGEWVWNEQQFIRIAIDEADALNDATVSEWSFRDVMLQRFQSYDFATGLQISDSVAERRALSLADVTDDSIYVQDVVALIDTANCNSTITLQRPGDTIANGALVWRGDTCPERFRLGDTLFSGLRNAEANEVRWVTHAYGQLPSLAGVVLIEQLEIMLPNDEELRINRSRRRNGTGPVTVSANLIKDDTTQALRDVQWRMDFSELSMFPDTMEVEVPSLSKTFTIDVPAAFENGFNNDALGVRHGVLASVDDSQLPGLLTLYPKTPDVQ